MGGGGEIGRNSKPLKWGYRPREPRRDENYDELYGEILSGIQFFIRISNPSTHYGRDTWICNRTNLSWWFLDSLWAAISPTHQNWHQTTIVFPWYSNPTVLEVRRSSQEHSRGSLTSRTLEGGRGGIVHFSIYHKIGKTRLLTSLLNLLNILVDKKQ